MRLYVTKTITNVPTAEFTDGLIYSPIKELNASISPIQDLHGYDYPWPGGGGKNLLEITTPTQTINDVTFTVDKAAGTVTANGTATKGGTYFYVKSTPLNVVSGESYIISGLEQEGGDNSFSIRVGRGSDDAYITATGSSTSARFTAPEDSIRIRLVVASGYTAQNLVFKPMLRLASDTDPTFEPYSNICPITGWTEATVMQNGKNLLDNVFTQGSFDANGEEIPTTGPRYRTGFIRVGSGKTYTFSQDIRVWGSVAYYYTLAKKFIGTQAWYSGSSITPPDDCAYIRLLLDSDPSGRYYQIEEGAQATEIVPYWGQPVTISFGSAGTVYGGTLVIAKGLLTVSRINFDLRSLTWIRNGDGQFYSRISSVLTSNADNNLCSCYQPSPDGAIDGNVDKSISSRGAILWIRDNRYTTAESFVANLPDNAQFVATLETPITYQITPEQLYILPGINTISASTGNVTVTYIVNPLLLGRDFMINSGYVLLDGGGLDLSLTTAQTISGIWDRTVSAINTGKPVWMYNTVYSENSEYTPIPVYVRFTSTTEITANAAGIVLTITSSNTVTVTA